MERTGNEKIIFSKKYAICHQSILFSLPQLASHLKRKNNRFLTNISVHINIHHLNFILKKRISKQEYF